MKGEEKEEESSLLSSLTLKIRGTVGFRTDINVCAFFRKKKFSLSLRFVEKTPYIYIYLLVVVVLLKKIIIII